MWNAVWPLLLVITSNVVYHLTSKGTPADVNPFLSLVVTYVVSAAAAFAMFFITTDSHNLAQCLSRVNWTSIVLGFALVGLESGYMYLYRAGWGISIASLTANLSVAMILLVIGVLCFHEGFGVRQLLGIALCAAGLILVNIK